MLEGSDEGEINALAITKEGEHFISGGEDKVVKLWGYDEGMLYFTGLGHSGAITKITISPDQKTIVSVGAEGSLFFFQAIFPGAIFMWKMPEEVILARADNELPALSKEMNEILEYEKCKGII